MVFQTSPSQPFRIAAAILAAGQSRRMEGVNKLLLSVADRPLLLHAVDAVLQSPVSPVLVITGFEAEAIHAILTGRPVRVIHNPDYGQGLATSVRTAISALSADTEAVLMCLGDMPLIRPDVISALVSAYQDGGPWSCWVPTMAGQRGNPVLWSRSHFAELLTLTGDVGGRALFRRHSARVREVSVDHAGILMDVDDPRDISNFTRHFG